MPAFPGLLFCNFPFRNKLCLTRFWVSADDDLVAIRKCRIEDDLVPIVQSLVGEAKGCLGKSLTRSEQAQGKTDCRCH